MKKAQAYELIRSYMRDDSDFSEHDLKTVRLAEEGARDVGDEAVKAFARGLAKTLTGTGH